MRVSHYICSLLALVTLINLNECQGLRPVRPPRKRTCAEGKGKCVSKKTCSKSSAKYYDPSNSECGGSSICCIRQCRGRNARCVSKTECDKASGISSGSCKLDNNAGKGVCCRDKIKRCAGGKGRCISERACRKHQGKVDEENEECGEDSVCCTRKRCAGGKGRCIPKQACRKGQGKVDEENEECGEDSVCCTRQCFKPKSRCESKKECEANGNADDPVENCYIYNGDITTDGICCALKKKQRCGTKGNRGLCMTDKKCKGTKITSRRPCPQGEICCMDCKNEFVCKHPRRCDRGNTDPGSKCTLPFGKAQGVCCNRGKPPAPNAAQGAGKGE